MIRLKVDNGCIGKIAEECGCTRNTVSLALKGATSSPIARQARALAIAKYNARKMTEVELTEKERLYGQGCGE